MDNRFCYLSVAPAKSFCASRWQRVPEPPVLSKNVEGHQIAEFFEESPIRIAFNSLYLSKYFGMVTTGQKEGNCVEHVLSDSQLIKTLTRKSELPKVSSVQPLC
jgi:hypothetical protein